MMSIDPTDPSAPSHPAHDQGESSPRLEATLALWTTRKLPPAPQLPVRALFRRASLFARLEGEQRRARRARALAWIAPGGAAAAVTTAWCASVMNAGGFLEWATSLSLVAWIAIVGVCVSLGSRVWDADY